MLHLETHPCAYALRTEDYSEEKRISHRKSAQSFRLREM